jgi:chorismate synthase
MIRFDTSRGVVEIRELRSMAEMIAAEVIQLAVWGAEITPHPKEMLIPVQHEGGLLAGAFDPAGELVGLIFHFPTRDADQVHSQMLAVREEWRGEGIGRQMKWFQRAWCLERGITRVRWTVDPLRAANAELNIRRLGAISATYLPDYYGPMLGIDAGVPTDRLLVEWYLSSEPVSCLAEAVIPPQDQGYPQVERALMMNGRGPVSQAPSFDGSPVLLALPDNFIHLAKTNPELALAWRTETRALFLQAFHAGYAISGFTRVGGAAYLLRKGAI